LERDRRPSARNARREAVATLGHQDVKTTMIYLHVPQQRQEEEIGRAFA
jgi:hypothetical protein